MWYLQSAMQLQFDLCQIWYHSHCENLSLRDLKILQDLTEDYLCLSCTRVGDVFDFQNALQRLTSVTRVGRLESAAKVENILLRGIPSVQTRTVKLQFRTCVLDTIAENILKKTGKFIAYNVFKHTDRRIRMIQLFSYRLFHLIESFFIHILLNNKQQFLNCGTNLTMILYLHDNL